MNDAANGEQLFRKFFHQATDVAVPYPYQVRLATVPADQFPELLDVPTGLGKTAAAVLAWLWRRRFAFHDAQKRTAIQPATPRRLVYCLPMRVLVEQTVAECIRWLGNLGLLAGAAEWHDPHTRKQLKQYAPQPEQTELDPNGWAHAHGVQGDPIAVHILMGGKEQTDWALWPERDAILIGTQDMLLSRALNRGYAAGRARWPLEFGLLSNDCLWVFDEVQLMSTGLATSLQLDAWRRSLRLRGEDGFRKLAAGDSAPSSSPLPQRVTPRPCCSLWMSATLSKQWLETAVDWKPAIEAAWQRKQADEQQFRERDRGSIGPLAPLFVTGRKTFNRNAVAQLKAKRGAGDDERVDVPTYLDALCKAIVDRLQETPDGVTLIIVNTVDRAVGLHERLAKPLKDIPVHLIHSRFRPAEREAWPDILSKSNRLPRVIVSTQVVEAGVDLSAKRLFTELAPWPSLVQRFGRCARYIDPETGLAESGSVYWMDTLKAPLPYDDSELAAAKAALLELDDAGLIGIEGLQVKRKNDKRCELFHRGLLLMRPDEAQRELNEERRKLFPYDPRFVPRDKDLFDLFDTTPDLTGADIDISRFIRDGDDLDVQVFWQDIPAGTKPHKKLKPRREELCPVPFAAFRKFVENLPSQGRVWRWNYVLGDWEQVTSDRREVIFPGQVFLLDGGCGGYALTRGWSTDSKTRVEPVPIPTTQSETDVAIYAPNDEAADVDTDDDHDEGERLSAIKKQWQSIEQHTRDVCKQLDELFRETGLTDGLTERERHVLKIAARWHDRGKAHDAFQAKLKSDSLQSPEALAAIKDEPAAKAPSGAWRPDKLRRHALPRDSDPIASDPDSVSAANVSADISDKRRPKFRHELASALAVLESLRGAIPDHEAFRWPDGLKTAFAPPVTDAIQAATTPLFPTATTKAEAGASPWLEELKKLSAHEVDLLVYLVAAHHGKVRMSLRSVPEDQSRDQPDPCPLDKPETRRARGVQDDDELTECRLPGPNGEPWLAPHVTLHLDPMELGLSDRYGPSWRERTQGLLERLGPFRLAYLEALLRIADCRASAASTLNTDQPQP